MQIFRIGILVMALVLGTIPAFVLAAETPASEASIRELIEITQSKKMIDGFMAQTTTM